MNRIIKDTKDGSKTLYVNALDETYHSHHGALQEAEHVFIKNGLKKINLNQINILEMGFGTGLNALVTIDEFLKNESINKINYYTLEKYPVNWSEIAELNYSQHFSSENMIIFNQKIHEAEWEKPVEILPNFNLIKINQDFFNLDKIDLPPIDVIYYDCFGARVQPDLWEENLIKMTTDKMAKNALFTTYSSKGSVRRILQSLNLNVEKLAGPPGKREMMNAWKNEL
ncbi:tRNA (5-methylaminomethyl-2-thiouridine)(34)-methyltransferase MnmD [Frigoriflavimonas asaccharolytica]|uniref:tRNA U34 5-methylaminomethyl-2-thiouridine-forming methyltransferase MnmC n=1 Tax=Frigoriflavimonas asaccharolytica TaxID=2735899 RepID=A0A8J8GB94_9FLAO|nr:tRNA (5-methylaminomethyl-2-thiouridine)(34)-methyltransferase MnmD [Frigoriflavimonas asaccharolytica]NRS93044.1 tRNA U34 5-methylaminomethyl-2-thiouridine-forming methyltransferase MnmC [Frigoriflavimonas asaccharolytica]